MKYKLTALLILMSTWLSVSAFEFKHPLSTVGMLLNPVSKHTYYVQGVSGIATDNQGFISNAGFVITPKGVVVIDALGSPSLAEKLLSLIRTKTDAPIIEVIVTHYHADHIYGLQTFKEQGAKIIAPEGFDDYLNSPQATERLEERRFSLEPWVNEKTELLYPDVKVNKTEVRTYGDVELVLNYLGAAHSNGDLTVFVKPDGVMFSGDVIFEGRIPYLGDSDTKAQLASLNDILKNDGINALIPGHGSYSNNPRKTIQFTRDYLAFMRENLGTAVDDLMSFEEAYDDIDWSRFEKMPAFEAANRINANSVFLSLEKELLAE